jgi:hypothetical protein
MPRRREPWSGAALVGVAFALAGCPAKDRVETRPAPCAKFGQNCEISPGKLGTCVQREACVGQICFVCQAQH